MSEEAQVEANGMDVEKLVSDLFAARCVFRHQDRRDDETAINRAVDYIRATEAGRAMAMKPSETRDLESPGTQDYIDAMNRNGHMGMSNWRAVATCEEGRLMAVMSIDEIEMAGRFYLARERDAKGNA